MTREQGCAPFEGPVEIPELSDSAVPVKARPGLAASPFRLVVILSHPVQYFSPLFAEIARRSNVDIEVWYGHRGALSGMQDEQFGTAVRWGTELLEGYRHRFFRNVSLRPRLGTHFWGVFNPGITMALLRNRPDAVLIPGWAYASYPLAWITARMLRIPVWLRSDNPWSQERLKSGPLQALKGWFLRHIAFPSVSSFLVVGNENADWYRNLGVPESRIIPAPHAVDTKHFSLANAERVGACKAIRDKYGIPQDACLFLFVGKLIEKKRPMDVLDAMDGLGGCHLLFVGEGALKPALGSAAQKAKGRIHFAGFVDQQELPSYYAAADVLVLPSGMGETWGLVVNEAMAAGLAVLVSDLCGCAPDLVSEGVNGFRFPCADAPVLRERMLWFIDHRESVPKFGDASRRIVAEFSLAAAAEGFERAARETSRRHSGLERR